MRRPVLVVAALILALCLGVAVGLAAGLAGQKGWEEGLRLGFAAAGAVVQTEGTAWCSLAEIRRLYPLVQLQLFCQLHHLYSGTVLTLSSLAALFHAD